MKKTGWAALMLTALLGSSTALAQTLPSNSLFSPGLSRMAELETTRPVVSAEASIALDEAMYVRDLSVLSDMLDGTTFGYRSDGSGETLSIARGGETLGVYALPESKTFDALTERMRGCAVLERVALSDIADWLEGLAQGDALALGFVVSEPFVLERTHSDDGTRLTKIRVSGEVAREGEAAYQVEGFLRQPAGRAPKDTFELTFTQDEENRVELLYSALRENEVAQKNREGTTSVRTTLKAAGKLAGSGFSSRLNVTMTNRWMADGDALNERISVKASLSHEDKTPGRRMQRLNSVDAETDSVLRLTTREQDEEPIVLRDEMTFRAAFDENTLLEGSAKVSIRMGGAAEAQEVQAVPISMEAIQALAQRLYPLLKNPMTVREGL